MRGRQNWTQAADGRGFTPVGGGRKVDPRVQRGEMIRGGNTLSGRQAAGGGSLRDCRPTTTDRSRRRPVVAMSAMSAQDPLRTSGVGRTIVADAMETKMTKCWAAAFAMITLSACASAAPPTVVGQGRTAVILGTVGQSEWCPAGAARVDLETGEYAFTPRAPRAVCQAPDLERPTVEGRLDASRLRALQQAFQRTITEGPNACRGGRRPPDEVIISNGGPHVLVVTTGQAMDAAPTELSCWTAAPWALHDLLDETFPSPR